MRFTSSVVERIVWVKITFRVLWRVPSTVKSAKVHFFSSVDRGPPWQSSLKVKESLPLQGHLMEMYNPCLTYCALFVLTIKSSRLKFYPLSTVHTFQRHQQTSHWQPQSFHFLFAFIWMLQSVISFTILYFFRCTIQSYHYLAVSCPHHLYLAFLCFFQSPLTSAVALTLVRCCVSIYFMFYVKVLHSLVLFCVF